MAEVDEALKDGSLNGKKHTQAEIGELKDSGLYYDRYAEYCRKSVRGKAALEQRAAAWKRDHVDKVDEKTGFIMALKPFERTFKTQLNRIDDIIDVEEHAIQLRPKPGSKHNLKRWRSTRGAKVESFHNSSKHFANLGTKWKTFQALQLEGACRFNADRREDSKQIVGDGDVSARAETRVAHYRPWLRRERNRLALAAGFDLPFPEDGLERPEDTGELFYMEYAFEQARRKANLGDKLTPDGIIEHGGCSCEKCSSKRGLSSSSSSSSSSGGDRSSGTGGGTASAIYPPVTRKLRRPKARADAVVVDAVGVGTTFRKYFPGSGFFSGTVIRLVPCEEDEDSDEEDLFAVKYEDSDTEELTRGEIETLLAGRLPWRIPRRASSVEALQIPADVLNPRRSQQEPARLEAHKVQQQPPLVPPLLALLPRGHPLPSVSAATMPHGQFAPGPRSFLEAVPPVMLVNTPQEPPKQEAEGSGPRPTKKSKKTPLCTCGAFDATRRARSLKGSGHGGIAYQHEKSCAWTIWKRGTD